MILGLNFTDQEVETPHRWLGGSIPIFQRTVMLNTAGAAATPHQITGFFRLIDIACFLVATDHQISLPYTSGGFWRGLFVTQSNIQIDGPLGMNNVTDGYPTGFATLWYTKQ